MAVPLMLTMTPSGGRVSRLPGDLTGIGGVLAMFDCRPPCPHRVCETETGPAFTPSLKVSLKVFDGQNPTRARAGLLRLVLEGSRCAISLS